MLESVDDYIITIGPKMLTRYEYARILGARSLQISQGAPVMADFEEEEEELRDPLLIAEKEIKKGFLPISVRRILPNGEHQDIPLNVLLKAGRERRGASIN